MCMNKEKDREGERSGQRGACKVCNVKGEKKEIDVTLNALSFCV